VLVLCVAGVTAVSMQVRCIDAAREAARLVARGDDAGADTAARRVAPPDAQLQLRRDGDFVVARVSAHSMLLPGVAITAEALSLAEPTLR
jgi:hypothetical protein